MEQANKATASHVNPREKQPFLPDDGVSAPRGGVQESVGQNRKLLVVDDNEIVLKAFELKLKASGFEVITATDGAAAVGLARQESPSLIILDMNFGVTSNFSSLNWDGFNIMQWLRRVQDGANTPIIVLSMEEPSQHEQPCLAAGAAAYFQKPVAYKTFLGTILQLLGDNAPAGQ
jgi:CheY-like chemotaxis protein